MHKRIHWTNELLDIHFTENTKPFKRLSNYSGVKKRITLQCLQCDHVFTPFVCNVLFRNSGCPSCAGILPHNNDIIDQKLIGRNIVRRSDYETARKPMLWQCTVCNHEWKSSSDNIVGSNKRGCANCDGQLQLTNETVDSRLHSNNRRIKRLGNVVNSREKIDWQCLDCLNVWSAPPNNIIKNKDPSGCPLCLYKRQKLVGELLIKYFTHTKINAQYYIKNKQINGKKAFVDYQFIINTTEIFVEYDGEQHFMPITYGLKTIKQAEKDYKNQIIRDKNLEKYCKKNGIVLVRLPYTLTDTQIEQKIIELKTSLTTQD